MKYPKILLTGGTGQVGYELQTTLKPLGNVWAPNLYVLRNSLMKMPVGFFSAEVRDAQQQSG